MSKTGPEYHADAKAMYADAHRVNDPGVSTLFMLDAIYQAVMANTAAVIESVEARRESRSASASWRRAVS